MNSIAVKKGREWLDANHPGWRERINWDTLNMRIWSKCMLGQALGGVSNIHVTPNLDEFGFVAITEEDNRFLIDLWKKEINDL
jgi:hypothetical protein